METLFSIFTIYKQTMKHNIQNNLDKFKNKHKFKKLFCSKKKMVFKVSFKENVPDMEARQVPKR